MATRVLMLAVLFASLIGISHAKDDLIIEGVYTENTPCDTESTEAKAPRVVIQPDEIQHSGGVCSIDSRRQDDKDLVMQVTCTFRSGAVMIAEIAFWRRDDGTVGMVQRDGNYEAVLYKCPD